MAGIMAADYWLVKKTHYDLPGLYTPHGRYRFVGGCNWRAAVAFLVPVATLLPGLAYSISGAQVAHIAPGVVNLYTFGWLFGFAVSIFLYTSLSWIFPAKETLLTDTIWDLDQIEGVPDLNAEIVGQGGVEGSGSGSGKEETGKFV